MGYNLPERGQKDMAPISSRQVINLQGILIVVVRYPYLYGSRSDEGFLSGCGGIRRMGIVSFDAVN